MKFRAIMILVLVVIFGSSTQAQFTGQLTPAPTITKGTMQGTANVGLYDGSISLLGHLRYGIGGYTDLGLRGGFVDFSEGRSDESALLLGGDIKYQVLELRIRDPLDLSVGGMTETMLGTPGDYITVGGSVIGSYPVKLNSGKNLTPYGRLLLRLTWIEGGGDDFDPAFTAGANFELGRTTSLSAEFQFDDPFGFLVGINFGL